MSDRDILLKRLDRLPANEMIAGLRSSLAQEDTQIIHGRVKVSVAETSRLWSTRLRNSEITRQRLLGVEELLVTLGTLAKQRKLEQIALVSSTTTGNLFFDAQDHFVGAVLSDR